MTRQLVFDTKDSLSYFPEAAKTIDDLDKTFLRFLTGKKVLPVKIPSLISEEVLDKCGYFKTFPQHLTQLKPYGNMQSSIKRYLTPAACIHIYPILEKECICQACYTTLAHVYRYENGMFEDPERLWEFSVREMVFVGTPDYVLSSLSEIKEKAIEVAKVINEKANIVVANDMFYPTRDNQLRMRIQRKNKLKEELLIPYQDRMIATASFNYHHFHFSKAFNFDNDGKVVTGCAGFGLDRWFLCTNQKEGC